MNISYELFIGLVSPLLDICLREWISLKSIIHSSNLRLRKFGVDQFYLNFMPSLTRARICNEMRTKQIYGEGLCVNILSRGPLTGKICQGLKRLVWLYFVGAPFCPFARQKALLSVSPPPSHPWAHSQVPNFSRQDVRIQTLFSFFCFHFSHIGPPYTFAFLCLHKKKIELCLLSAVSNVQNIGGESPF